MQSQPHYDSNLSKQYIYKHFDESALPSLVEYIKIPNLSRDYDKDYATNGLLEKAAEHIKDWVVSLNLKNATVQIIKHQGYTPIIFTEIKGDLPQTVCYYGHFDKQPPFQGWEQGLGATTPVIRNGKLYGRGGADDGYSTYSTMLSIKSLQQQNIKLPRCVMITQGDEQSGDHIGHYIVTLREKIGNPSIFLCLDSGTCDYQTFSLTTSLRGVMSCIVTVEVLKEGVHSGDSSGIVPSSFRILRMLLSRLENQSTGEMIPQFQVAIPPQRYKEVFEFAQQKGASSVFKFPFLEKVKPVSEDAFTSVVNRGWKAQMEVVGADGFPKAEGAGNVMRPSSTFKISIRLPPTKDVEEAKKVLQERLTKDVPYGAKVKIQRLNASAGWSAPLLQPYLEKAIDQSAHSAFGSKKQHIAQGGSIPLMNLLQQLWPKAQFLITGVLGPESNAHGPNEFLHLDYTKKLTVCMSEILAKVSHHFSINDPS